MPNDNQTTLAELKSEVQKFVGERDWEKFHSPKNISMAMSVEAAELMEHFQWISQAESRQPDQQKLVEIGEEMSDVFCYLLALANTLDIDFTAVFLRKMELNRQKYPAEQFRGRFGADDPSPVSSNSTGD